MAKFKRIEGLGIKYKKPINFRKKVTKRKEPSQVLTELEKVGKKFSRKLRHNVTYAERQFRIKLIATNISFGFQKPFSDNNFLYIADFYIPMFGLIIELDGGYHNTIKQEEHDSWRDRWFKRHGISVWRMTNEESFIITKEDILKQFGKYNRIKTIAH